MFSKEELTLIATDLAKSAQQHVRPIIFRNKKRATVILDLKDGIIGGTVTLVRTKQKFFGVTNCHVVEDNEEYPYCQIDGLVYELYGLTEEERKVVEG